MRPADTAARFAGLGVDPSRLVFQGHTSGADYHAAFDQVDLALDPTPAPGGTTSLEALAHGVPVLTLAGEDFYSRIGVQVVAGGGFPELVASSAEGYVAIAAALAADPERLQALRADAPARFASSVFRDEAGVTRRLEDAYRAMFARWCGAAEALDAA